MVIYQILKVDQLRYLGAVIKKIHQRIDNIIAADSVEMLVLCRIGRCHPLHGDRKGQYSMDLIHPYRLIFTRVDNEIQIVEVQEIVDYH